MGNSNAYMREYMLARYHRRRQQAVDLLGGRCTDCGSGERLEFDHVDPGEKTFNIAKVWSYREETFWAEIRKCQLRCHDCHKIRTSQQQSVEHGGGLTGKKNCYCNPCRTKKNEYNRNRRRNMRKAVRQAVGA